MRMMKKHAALFFCFALMTLLVSGCGSQGGATTYANTVSLSPTGVSSDTSSTVLISANTDDSASAITIVSTANPNVPKPSQVTIKSTTIAYTRTSNSPTTAPATLPTQAGPSGVIPPGGSVVFPFTVASGIFKDKLVSESGFVPGSSRWQYFVTYTFTGVEDTTNNEFTFTVDGGKITFQ